MKIEALKTPTERFQSISDFPYSENYYTLGDGLDIHYVDVNSSEKNVVVLLHGEPSWSYLYRKMIPVFAQKGFRVVVPDLIGFGKSDKPIHQKDYTYQRHLDWIRELLFDHLDLKNINLFVQDWGGLIGLRLVAEQGDRFQTVTAANTFLPTGQQPPNDAFKKWQDYSKKADPFPVGQIIQRATVSELSDEVVAAYDAPFPDESFKAGAKIFPSLVPTTPDDPQSIPNQQAWASLSKFEKPFLTLFSDKDPIMTGLDKFLHQLIPGCKGQPHSTTEGAGHFLQEEKGEEIANKMIDWFIGLKML